ncbi:GCN5-like 1 [Moelleriella libera RCEF 2490]|uniref:Biogenesis of lysosome-related organelles complex 1 subunit 1 n=1 Tax=Moelleriella libera RCEF 2490 TaxID=1081109 RepID=A0A167YJ83_9HYPO|nr:GCN5-like 1 [Moelleriella libera RCEF 2490]
MACSSSCSSCSSFPAGAAAAAPPPSSSSSQQQHQHQHQPRLPSSESQRHVSEARAAIVASMSNLVDAELQSRARILHDNAAMLDKQERQVARATDALRREREKLAREADGAARQLKEVGNVQNWAEVLERGFLVLEETARLAAARRGAGEESTSCCSCSSCSECGSDDGGGRRVGGEAGKEEEQEEQVRDAGRYGEGRMDVDVDLANSLHRARDDGGGAREAESSTASAHAKEPETTAITRSQ